jgi:hypothetical protein
MTNPWLKQASVIRLTAAATAVLLSSLTVAGCSAESGPSTQAQVCDGYDELSQALLEGNGLFGNPLFDTAGDLGDAASRFEANAEVQADGQRLQEIADADSTSGAELEQATRAVAAACGAPPLSVNAVVGG